MENVEEKKALPRPKRRNPEKAKKKSLEVVEDIVLAGYKLNPQQKMFVLNYMNSHDAVDAASKAGYKNHYNPVTKSKSNVGPNMLSTNEEIKRAVKDLSRSALGQYGINEFAAMRQVANIAFADPRKLFDSNDDQLLIHQIDDDTAMAIENIEITYNANGDKVTKIKMASKTKALENIMKYLGAYAPTQLEVNHVPALVLNMIKEKLDDEKVVSEQ